MSNSEINSKINTALKYHQSGQLAEAEIIYRQVIEEDPNNASALNLYGILLYQHNRFNEAVEYARKAVEINPNSYFCTNLGNIYKETGKMDLAIDLYNQALEYEPDNAKVYFNLGYSYKIKNELNTAIEYYKRSVELDPSNQAAYANLGNIYAIQKKLNEAVECYKKAIELNPEDASMYNSLGNTYFDLKEIDKAIECYKKAVKLKPNYEEVYINLGSAYLEKNDNDMAIDYLEFALELNDQNYLTHLFMGNVLLDKEIINEAIESYQTALNLKPDDPGILLNMGNAYKKNEEFDKAINIFYKILEIKPDFIEAYLNLANINIEKGDYDKAINNCEKSLELNPQYAEAYLNLGNACKNKREIDKAINYFSKAVEINQDYADAHFNLGTSYLLNKNFEKGWAEYEWRFKKKKSTCPKILGISQSTWDGSSLENKTIYVCYEQGFGDGLQFARFIPVLRSKGAKVIFKVPEPLEKLMKQSDLNADIICACYPDNLIKFDTFAYIMSLPHLLKTNLNSIPFSSGYLKADPDKVNLYKEKYFNNENFKIGIKWLGNPDGRKNREIPLKLFFKLAEIKNAKLYSFQKGYGVEQLEEVPLNIEIIKLGNTFNDFSDTAAALENIDLLVSNDSSLVHLSGALGKKTWVLLPFVPEWRWMLDREDTPWYDSVKLFRQKEPGNWDEVMERVIADLRIIIN